MAGDTVVPMYTPAAASSTEPAVEDDGSTTERSSRCSYCGRRETWFRLDNFKFEFEEHPHCLIFIPDMGHFVYMFEAQYVPIRSFYSEAAGSPSAWDPLRPLHQHDMVIIPRCESCYDLHEEMSAILSMDAMIRMRPQ